MEAPQDPVGDLVARVGEDAVREAVAAFYRRIPGDDLLGPMYPAEDLEGAEERLRDFLIQRFGGSTRYTDRRGHPRLRMRHAPFAVDQAARDRWMELMTAGMAEAGWAEPERERALAFLSDVASFLVNRPS